MPKARPKIHFAAMIGILADQDLFSWWIPYYQSLKLDSYTVYLHETLDAELNLGSKLLFEKYGFTVVMLPEGVVRDNPWMPNEPGVGVRGHLMDALCLTYPKEDFFITADGDEIQEWPEHPRAYIERGIRIVLGEHVDCFDETLHAPSLEKTLDENYPIRFNNLSTLWRPKDDPLNPRKICMAPVRYPVDHTGSHDLKKEYMTKSPFGLASGPINVLHYRWRETAFLRVKNRPNWPPEQLQFIKNFFSVAE